jgi:hypothetical protein
MSDAPPPPFLTIQFAKNAKNVSFTALYDNSLHVSCQSFECLLWKDAAEGLLEVFQHASSHPVSQAKPLACSKQAPLPQRRNKKVRNQPFLPCSDANLLFPALFA